MQGYKLFDGVDLLALGGLPPYRAELALREPPLLRQNCGCRLRDGQPGARIPRRLKRQRLTSDHRETYVHRAFGERLFGNPQARNRSWLDTAPGSTRPSTHSRFTPIRYTSTLSRPMLSKRMVSGRASIDIAALCAGGADAPMQAPSASVMAIVAVIETKARRADVVIGISCDGNRRVSRLFP